MTDLVFPDAMFRLYAKRARNASQTHLADLVSSDVVPAKGIGQNFLTAQSRLTDLVLSDLVFCWHITWCVNSSQSHLADLVLSGGAQPDREGGRRRAHRFLARGRSNAWDGWLVERSREAGRSEEITLIVRPTFSSSSSATRASTIRRTCSRSSTSRRQACLAASR